MRHDLETQNSLIGSFSLPKRFSEFRVQYVVSEMMLSKRQGYKHVAPVTDSRLQKLALQKYLHGELSISIDRHSSH